jgi:H-type small acid-soluble spore protein
MDTKRAKDIINSSDFIEVLYQGQPVRIENVTLNNTAEVTYIESHLKEVVPVYKLVEASPRRES